MQGKVPLEAVLALSKHCEKNRYFTPQIYSVDEKGRAETYTTLNFRKIYLLLVFQLNFIYPLGAIEVNACLADTFFKFIFSQQASVIKIYFSLLFYSLAFVDSLLILDNLIQKSLIGSFLGREPIW